MANGSEGAFIDYQTGRDYLSICLFEITDRIASFDWTIDDVKRLHLDLSREMNREVEAIMAFDENAAASLAEIA